MYESLINTEDKRIAIILLHDESNILFKHIESLSNNKIPDHCTIPVYEKPVHEQRGVDRDAPISYLIVESIYFPIRTLQGILSKLEIAENDVHDTKFNDPNGLIHACEGVNLTLNSLLAMVS